MARLMRVCCAGIAPESIAQVYASKRLEAEGQLQMLYHTRPAYALGHLSMLMRLMYSANAWSHQTAALLMPVWIAVPVIQIIFGVFPFDPNRSDQHAVAVNIAFAKGRMACSA